MSELTYHFTTAQDTTLRSALDRLAEEVGVPSVLSRPVPRVVASRADVTRKQFTASLLRRAADEIEQRLDA